MKRSKFEELLTDLTWDGEARSSAIALTCKEAERAGVVWDPEEDEVESPGLAPRLYAFRYADQWTLGRPGVDRRTQGVRATEAELRTAAALYNQRAELRRVAGEMRDARLLVAEAVDDAVGRLMRDWAGVLTLQ